MKVTKNKISVDKDVQGYNISDFAKIVLYVYIVLHLIGSGMISYTLSQEIIASSFHTYTDVDWNLFFIYFAAFAAPVIIIYGISILFIHLYTNTVATREAIYHYINNSLKNDD